MHSDVWFIDTRNVGGWDAVHVALPGHSINMNFLEKMRLKEAFRVSTTRSVTRTRHVAERQVLYMGLGVVCADRCSHEETAIVRPTVAQRPNETVSLVTWTNITPKLN
jgi:hypothetical protein